MNESRLVLIGVAVLLEAPQDEDAMHARMEAVSEALTAAAREFTAGQPDCKPIDVTSYHYLGEEWENAARCSYCGRWATDVYKSDRIDGIDVGFVLDGRFMCEQCRIWVHNGGLDPAGPPQGENTI